MLSLLVCMAIEQRRLHPGKNFVPETEAAQQSREPIADHLFPNVRFGAFSLVSRAVVIDVPGLLDLADHRAAAMAAIYEACESEIALGLATGLAGIPAIQHALSRSQSSLVAAGIAPPVPVEFARIKPRAQYPVNVTGRKRPSRPSVNEARVPRFDREFFCGKASSRIPTEHVCDGAGNIGVRLDDLLAVRSGQVAVAERRLRWSDPLLRLFELSLACFFRKIVDVVLGHQHFYAVDKLIRGFESPDRMTPPLTR